MRYDLGKHVARSAGIEPTTPAFGGQYSIHWATSAEKNNLPEPEEEILIPKTMQAVFYLI